MKKKMMVLIVLTGFTFLISGCGPEVGSNAWCKNMKAKNKADWTLKESKDFAKHCLFK